VPSLSKDAFFLLFEDKKGNQVAVAHTQAVLDILEPQQTTLLQFTSIACHPF
jgi:hypothetical protein